MPKNRQVEGLEYSPDVIGKHLYRIRERHLAEHLAPLIARNAIGAVKLDLVLRGLALLPNHAGRRNPGTVLPTISYETLHDLCRPSTRFTTVIPEDEDFDPKVVAKKRKWVGENLERLEDMRLVQRTERPGGRPLIVVKRDDGSRKPFDDPDGTTRNTYVTISGHVVASDWFRLWSSPEVAAYLAAMVADRYARNKVSGMAQGGAIWFQPLHWFADSKGIRPPGHVAIPFSERTLERGFKRLKEAGLVNIETKMKNPYDHRKRFKRPRNIYTNRFNELEKDGVVIRGQDLINLLTS